MISNLPIAGALPALRAALLSRDAAVLVAPPGAGKTTVVPLALIDEPWSVGRKLIVLEPRRLAARAAAERMATSVGEAVGRTVGYRVRLASKVSAETRVEVVTEGVFTRMILDDPGLEGVAGVLFDEFHERSLDADLGLAFARDAQDVLRGDLRLLVMSATLDAAAVADRLGGAPVIESPGRAFPVETRYLGRDPALPFEAQVERAVWRALSEEDGGVLVFLPGAAEIRRVETRLAERLAGRADVIIAPLFGALAPGEQDSAISPAPAGKRKVVLATSIAETSLTLEGVRVVVDGGLSRVPRFDPGSGLTRLVTVRVPLAAADQRRGRAGRTEPGVCYRLWDEAETRGLAPFARPEMLESDLSGVALALARWGARDPAALLFLDRPPAGAWAEARGLLERLGALDARGDLSAHGARLAAMPLPPRLAHMVLGGAEKGSGRRAAGLAALLTEPGLGGGDVGLADRLRRFERDGSGRARDARALAARWARLAGGGAGEDVSDALLLAEAYPERIAKRKGVLGRFQLSGGRGAELEASDPLAREDWLAVGELGGGGARDHIRLAVPVSEVELREAFPDRFTVEERIEVDEAGYARARRIERFDRIVLHERMVEKPDRALLAGALVSWVRERGVPPSSEAADNLRERVAFLRSLEGEAWPDLSDAALLARAEEWLPSLLQERGSLAALTEEEHLAAVSGLVPPELSHRLRVEAPEVFVAPTDSRLPIRYRADGGPLVEVRVQELFGLDKHPTVAGGRVPLTLVLLSPARRPVQVTADLPAFWAGSWKAVRTEMRGRYPKHPWPEDPLAAAPTTRAKPRGT